VNSCKAIVWPNLYPHDNAFDMTSCYATICRPNDASRHNLETRVPSPRCQTGQGEDSTRQRELNDCEDPQGAHGRSLRSVEAHSISPLAATTGPCASDYVQEVGRGRTANKTRQCRHQTHLVGRE